MSKTSRRRGEAASLRGVLRLVEDDTAAVRLGGEICSANPNQHSTLAIPLKGTTLNLSLDTFFTSMTWKSSGEALFTEDLRPESREHCGKRRTVQVGVKNP